MPEGDTIHRTARSLAQALRGARVESFASTIPAIRSAGPGRLVGQTVAAVQARGKHLLIWFEPEDVALHTHLGMTGSWHLYRPGQRWSKPPAQARATIGVPGRVAVCFTPATCQLLSRVQVRRGTTLAALGPDPFDEPFDHDEASRRLQARGAWTIGEALLDQRVMAGIGNVYRSEVLFLHGVNPWAAVAELPAGVRDALLTTARRLLRVNAEPGARRRVTTAAVPGGAGALYVYGRARRPCRRCRTPVRAGRLGSHARVVYWCPTCQPDPGR